MDSRRGQMQLYYITFWNSSNFNTKLQEYTNINSLVGIIVL